MENLNMYNFIGKVALEYRLSLENICKLLKKEPTEENKKMIYESIMKTCSKRSELIRSYRFLFNYETINEDQKVSEKELSDAKTFIAEYNAAKKTNNDAIVRFVSKKLTRTDRDFKAITQKDLSKPLSPSEAYAIAKYRIKYCISKEAMTEIINIGDDKIRLGESKIADEILQKKLKLLSDYLMSLELNRMYKKR